MNNKRLKNISPFIVMDIVREANKFEDTIHFEIGQPDIKPSPKVQEALHSCNNFSYTESMGLRELRVAISKHYKRVYGIEISYKNILITPGTSGAFLVAYSLTCDYNQTLGFSDPGYPCYKNITNMLNITPHPIKVFEDSNYQITPMHLQNTTIDALQISNPANPTGNVYDNQNLKELIEYCQRKDIKFISDELYHGLTYDTTPQTALAYSKDIFVINGFSKYYSMPGFRVGWLIVPNNYIKKAEEIAQNIFISAPTISQYAALKAFDYPYLEKTQKIYQERRDYLYNELKQLFHIPKIPQGAFYIWADISKYSSNSLEFAYKLLQDIHVATTPGIDFGKNNTNKYIRFAYTRDIEHMQEGIKRLKEYLN